MRTQVNGLRDLQISGLDHGALGGKIVTYFGIHLNLCFLLHVLILLLWYPPSVQPDSAKQATSMLVKHLANLSGHIVEEAGACKMVRASHEGWSVGGSNQEDVITELDPGNWRLLTLYLSLECTFCPPFPQWEVFQGHSLEKACVVGTIWTGYVTEPH